MPVRNEIAYIERSLGAVLGQDYPADRLEVLVVDGMSDDGTREYVAGVAESDPRLQLLDNPAQIVPPALNAGIAEAKGDIVVRVDGHCIIAPDYVSTCVNHLMQEEVEAVGGPIETVGETPEAQSIALAMSSWFGVGGSAFRTIMDEYLLVETVAFPAYWRQTLREVGPFDEELVRNQDDEYNYRLRKMGGRILLAPDVQAVYYSRSSLPKLWRQYYQYGYWKVRVMQKHPMQMRWRQFVPAIFVAVVALLVIAALFYPPLWSVLGLVLLLYLVADLGVSLSIGSRRGWSHVPRLLIIYPILHLSYGLGFWHGMIRFAGHFGAAESAPQPAK